MTRGEATARVVRHWLDMAHDSLASAEAELAAGRLAFALNRCYFAAFYAASAVLLSRGQRFVKHAGVRAALHRDLVKAGLLPQEHGRLYDQLFEDRQEGDYVEFVSFEPEEVTAALGKAKGLVATLESLVLTPQQGGGE